jgi:hypothetical protein
MRTMRTNSKGLRTLSFDLMCGSAGMTFAYQALPA